MNEITICNFQSDFSAFPQGPPAPPQPPSPPPLSLTTLGPDADEPQSEEVEDPVVDGEEPDPAPLLILPPAPPPEPKEDDGKHIALDSMHIQILAIMQISAQYGACKIRSLRYISSAYGCVNLMGSSLL